MSKVWLGVLVLQSHDDSVNGFFFFCCTTQALSFFLLFTFHSFKTFLTFLSRTLISILTYNNNNILLFWVYIIEKNRIENCHTAWRNWCICLYIAKCENHSTTWLCTSLITLYITRFHNWAIKKSPPTHTQRHTHLHTHNKLHMAKENRQWLYYVLISCLSFF